MKVIKSIILIYLFFFCYNLQAQVKTNFNNESLISAKGRFAKINKTKIDFELAAKDITSLLETKKVKLLNLMKQNHFNLQCLSLLI